MTVLQLLRDSRALRKQPGVAASICAALRREVATFKHEIAEARKRIAELNDNHWSAVE